MVEPQSSKLMVRVRFPSSPPFVTSGHHSFGAPKFLPWVGHAAGGLRVKKCVWLGVSWGLDLAFLDAD